jgi:hypothetical protein
MDNEAVSVTVPVTVFPSDYVPLLLSGSVSPASLLMTEQVAGKKYHWEGDLLTGSFKFLYHPSYDLPSLNKGTNDASLTERTDAAQPDELFTINGGFYKIDVDRENMTISLATPQYTFPVIYLIGEGVVEADWNFTLPAYWNNDNPGLYVWYCTLTSARSGIFHFRCGNNWPSQTFRPRVNNQSISDTGVQYQDGGADTQWQVRSGDEGYYKVTLDVIDMKVYFEKQ